MSVKSKVKRCNQEIKRLEAKIFELENEKYKLTRIEKVIRPIYNFKAKE